MNQLDEILLLNLNPPQDSALIQESKSVQTRVPLLLSFCQETHLTVVKTLTSGAHKNGGLGAKAPAPKGDEGQEKNPGAGAPGGQAPAQNPAQQGSASAGFLAKVALLGSVEEDLKNQRNQLIQSAVSASAPPSASKGAMGASAPGSKGGVGGSFGAGPPIPTPDVPYPNNGGTGSNLSPALPPQGTNGNANGYLDKLQTFIDDMMANPNNLQLKANFVQFLINLNAAGDMKPGGTIMNWLNASPDIMNNLMPQLTDQLTMWAFFAGCGGVNGAQGAANMLSQLNAALDGSNSYLAAMKNQIGAWGTQGSGGLLDQFTAAHTAGGDLCWFVTIDQGPQVKYVWGGNYCGDDTAMITKMICSYAFQSKPPFELSWGQDDSDAGLDAFLRNGRIAALSDLLARYKNPEIAISMWLMSSYDNHFQNAEGGLAGQTNNLTDMTNNYATPLLQFAGKIGSLEFDNPQDVADTQQFMVNLLNSSTLVNADIQLNPLTSSWNTNAYDVIMNTAVPTTSQPGAPTETLGAMITSYRSGGMTIYQFMNRLNYLNLPAGDGGGSMPPSDPNPDYQSLLSGLQQTGSLITGESKTVSTQLSTVGNVDNAVIKFGSSVVDPTGGGLVQLMLSIIKAQISN